MGGRGNDNNCIYCGEAGSLTAVTGSRQCLFVFFRYFVGGKVRRWEMNKAKLCKVDYFKHAKKIMWPVSLFWLNVDILIEKGSPIKVDKF
jgi:hypothetical protein